MSIEKVARACLFWIAWLISFIVTSHYQVLDIITVIAFAISATSWVWTNQKNEQKRITKGTFVSLCLITGYLAFSLFGRNIFMECPRTVISPTKLFAFVILTISLYPISTGTLEILHCLCKRKKERSASKKQIRIAGGICTFLVLIVDLLLSTAYYPCNMTTDSYGHWLVATGKEIVNDYSPVAFNLLIKGLFKIFGTTNPYVYCVFQIVLFAIVIGDIAAYLKYKRVPLYILMVGSIFIALCPSSYMLLTYLSKNPLTAVLSLWVTVSLVEVITDSNKYLRSIAWNIKAIMAITGLYFTRENNVVIILPLICFVIWFAFNHKEYQKRIIVLFAGVSCIIGIMYGIVYNVVDYEHYDKSHETIRPLLAPVGSALQQELQLPDEVIDEVEKVLPISEWKSRYDPLNSDIITWGNPKPQYKAVSLSEAFGIYFKMLSRYPDIVVRDRLDGTDMIWNARSKMVRCVAGLVGNGDYIDESLPHNGIAGSIFEEIKRFARSLFLISVDNAIFDSVIWKNGLYIYLLFVVAVFLLNNRKGELLWSILPSVFILGTYILVIAWQMYFYIWFFPLSVFLLSVVTVVVCGEEKWNATE